MINLQDYWYDHGTIVYDNYKRCAKVICDDIMSLEVELIESIIYNTLTYYPFYIISEVDVVKHCVKDVYANYRYWNVYISEEHFESFCQAFEKEIESYVHPYKPPKSVEMAKDAYDLDEILGYKIEPLNLKED